MTLSRMRRVVSSPLCLASCFHRTPGSGVPQEKSLSDVSHMTRIRTPPCTRPRSSHQDLLAELARQRQEAAREK